jgi:hypothetical protein
MQQLEYMAYLYVFDFTKYYYNGLPSIYEANSAITHCPNIRLIVFETLYILG